MTLEALATTATVRIIITVLDEFELDQFSINMNFEVRSR